jgi:DNA-binding response OmpR family regulator
MVHEPYPSRRDRGISSRGTPPGVAAEIVTPIHHVLLVDDDAALRDMLRDFLESHNIEVSMLSDATHLMHWLTAYRPSLVVLDIMMEGVDGLSALKHLRASGVDTPVILLSGRDDSTDRAQGLESGADDYLGKPFVCQELLARIRAVLRRTLAPATFKPASSAPRHAVSFGTFRLDFTSHTLFRGDEPLKLRKSEYALLEVLASHPMEALSRARIVTLLHGPDVQISERGIDVPIWHLRRLLEDEPTAPQYIQTIRGNGYMFVPAQNGMLPAL